MPAGINILPKKNEANTHPPHISNYANNFNDPFARFCIAEECESNFSNNDYGLDPEDFKMPASRETLYQAVIAISGEQYCKV